MSFCQYHCFHFCGFVVTFEITKCEAFNFVIFQDFCLCKVCAFRFHMNLTMNFSFPEKLSLGLSCCISLCTVFFEPRVGQLRAKRLGDNARSPRKFRHVYSLLVGTAAVALFSPG